MKRDLVTAQWAQERMPRREHGAHKWGVGAVVVIAGSAHYTGAAWLVCRTAGRAGAGIVFLASPRSVCQSLAPVMPEVAHIPLPTIDHGTGVRAALDELVPKLERATAVVIGPGLGMDDDVQDLLGALFGLHPGEAPAKGIGFGPSEILNASARTIFHMTSCPIVIDADALTWLSRQDEWWTRVPARRLVLTPHPGELGRLTGQDPETLTLNLEEAALHYGAKWQQTVVCKGAPTVASDGERLIVAGDAPTSLATAGSGDCFAGMIGALISQGLSPLDAAGCAMYIGCAAARRCEAEFGDAGVIAADLPDAVAKATHELTRGANGKDSSWNHGGI